MTALLLALAILLGIASPLGSAERSCADDLREARALLGYYVGSKTRDIGEAVRTIAEQQQVIEALQAEVTRLRALPTGQGR